MAQIPCRADADGCVLMLLMLRWSSRRQYKSISTNKIDKLTARSASAIRLGLTTTYIQAIQAERELGNNNHDNLDHICSWGLIATLLHDRANFRSLQLNGDGNMRSRFIVILLHHRANFLSLQLNGEGDMTSTPIKGAELPTNPVVSICGQAIRRMVNTGHVHWLGRRAPNRQTVRAQRSGRSDLFKGVSSSIYKYRSFSGPSTISKSLHKGTLRSSHSSISEEEFQDKETKK